MNSSKTTIVLLIASIVLLIGSVVILSNVRSIGTGQNTFVEKLVDLGSVSGPEITSDFLSVNGVETHYRYSKFNSATTTVLALRSPLSATSTLDSFVCNFAVSSTTASTVHIAKATTAFATTTNINTYAIGADAQATIVASTTGSVAGDATIFAPGTYAVVGMTGGAGTFSPTGGCSAEFIVAK